MFSRAVAPHFVLQNALPKYILVSNAFLHQKEQNVGQD
jgi:hypothetical protein